MVKLTREQGQRITAAIRKAESLTSGEIRVHWTGSDVKDAYVEAVKLFGKLGMHRTRQRNGVLILVAPKNRVFAIIGDSGIQEKAGAALWNAAREAMADRFRRGDLEGGILEGVRLTGEALARFFPRQAGDVNELPDLPSQ